MLCITAGASLCPLVASLLQCISASPRLAVLGANAASTGIWTQWNEPWLQENWFWLKTWESPWIQFWGRYWGEKQSRKEGELWEGSVARVLPFLPFSW